MTAASPLSRRSPVTLGVLTVLFSRIPFATPLAASAPFVTATLTH